MLILFLKRCKFSDFWKQNQENEGNLLKMAANIPLRDTSAADEKSLRLT